MKKLFYIFASAIVALGAVACQNEIEEGINANNESLSFTANIDEATRVAFDEDGKTIWAAGDEIEVIFGEKTFVFTNTEDDVNTFTCTETGVTSIVGQEIEAIYSYENGRTIESSKGIAGSHLVAEGVFPEAEQGSALIFRLQNALLYFFANTEVTFNSSEDIFAVEGVASNELTISASEEMQYVAIKGATTDFSYSVGEKVIKELAAFTFEAGKKYNLGNLNGEKNIAEGVVENLEGEYIISSEAGLFWLAATVEEGNNLQDKTVKLGADITLTQPWTPIGNKGAGKYNDGYAYSFAGTFDGQGYAIKNMVVENDGVTGFFGYKWYGDIKNVKFENAIVKGDHYAGVVVGWTDGAQRGTRWFIDNCDVTGSTITIAVKNNDNGDKAGAITGYAYGVTIQNCDIDNTTITGYRDLGAIAGTATSNTDEGQRNAIVKDNTLGENIEIVIDNTINYNSYKIQSDYNVGVYVGRILRNAVVEDNTGDATITWGEIAAELSAVEKLNEQIAAGETEITISESFEMTAEDPKITIAEGQDVTITLAEGVEITGTFSDSSYDSLFDIRKGGTLTIGGEGSIALISVKGNVSNYGQYIFENNGGTLNIVGGTYNMEVTGNGSATWYIPALLNNNSTLGETTTNISGGRFYSETCINIMRQFINNKTYNATINITGGEFEGTGTKTYGIWNHNSGGSGLGYINISGDVQMNNVYVENDAPKANAVVSGGTFGYQPGTAASSYNAVTIAEGYVTVKDGETYTVATLQDALTAGASHIILPEGTYNFGNLTNFPASVTFEGVSKENTIVNMNKSLYLQDKVVNFKNLSYTAPAGLTYSEGSFAFIHHAAEFNFDNCIINRLRLNVVKSTIKDSTFEVVTSSGFDGYGLYYYGRSNGTDSEVLVDNCEFNSKQKAICIYNEGPVSGFNLTVNKTTFTASETTDKTAISIHTEKGITGTLTINESSATGFYDVNGGLWRVFNNETKVDTENFTVTVDGEKVWPIINYTYDEASNTYEVFTPAGLVEVFAQFTAGATINIMDDLDMTGKTIDATDGNKGFTINGNDKTISNLSGTEPGLFVNKTGSSDYYFYNVKLENCSVVSTTNYAGLFVGDGDTCDELVIEGCEVTNCTVESAKYAAAFVAYTAGYNVQSNGPVYSDVTIKDCVVTGGSITGGGSTAAAIGHAGGNADTTNTITNLTVSGVAINGEDAEHTGIVVGTAHIGKTIITNATYSNVTGNYNTNYNLFGRFVPGTTGELTIDGKMYVSNDTQLVAAVAANKSEIVLMNGTYNLANVTIDGKTFTLMGQSKEGVIVQTKSQIGQAYTANITFDNLTVENDTDSYGDVVANVVTYNNCIYKGTMVTYSKEVNATDTAFVPADAEYYNVHIYSTGTTNFTNCTFTTTASRSVYAHADTAAKEFNINFTRCSFETLTQLTSSDTRFHPAIRLHTEYGIYGSLTITDCEIVGDNTFGSTYNDGLWVEWNNNTKALTNNFTTTVDGVEYEAKAIVDGIGYYDLAKALTAAGTTKVITLLADATVSQQCIVKENGKTLTVNGKYGKTSKKGDGNVYVYPTSDWKLVGSTSAFGNWAYGSSNAVMLQEYSTIVVIRNVKLAANTEFKFSKDGSWADGTQVGAYGSGTGDISYDSWYGVDKRWTEFKANIKNTTAGTYDLFFATDTGSWYVTKSTNYKEM